MKKYSMLLCLFALLSCNSKKDEPKQPIVIGYYGSLTGREAAYGVQTLGGVELAMVKLNRAGGIDGRKIVLRHYDTKSNTKLAEEAVQKLIEVDKVVAIIGENVSGRTIAGAKIAQEKSIPMITPTGTNPKITQVGDYIFRACFIDSFQGEVIARFAYNNLKYKTAAIYRDGATPYSIELADFFIKKFTELGGKIVADETYNTKDVIYLSALMKIKKSKPDFFFIPGYYFDVSRIAFQARDLKINAPFMGGDGWESKEIFAESKGAIENSYFSSHFTTADPRPEVKVFADEFATLFGFEPDSFSASGFDAANLVFQAITNANSTEPKAIRDALAQTQNFAGITGTISFDASRNPMKPAVVMQVKGDGFKYVETVQP